MKIISCYFGKRETSIHPAPQNFDCYFFSNNKKLKAVAEKMGWEFLLIKNEELTADYHLSSLQSKYVKFLQFDKCLINWEKDESILYFDHKFIVDFSVISEVVEQCKLDALMFNSNVVYGNIQDEINEALPQKRYAKSMAKTIAWIDSLVEKQAYSYENSITLTGFIFYKNVKKMTPLCDEVYRACMKLDQPECQIIWSVLSQKLGGRVTKMNITDFDVALKRPKLTMKKKIINFFIKIIHGK